MRVVGPVLNQVVGRDIGFVPDRRKRREAEIDTARVLETMSVAVRQAGDAQTVAGHVHAALGLAYETQGAQAVLVAQQVIGIKSFQEQRNQ